MNKNEDPTKYWLEEAKASIKKGDTYSAIREFLGAINRSIANNKTIKTLQILNHIVNYLIEMKSFDVLYAVLGEALASYRKINRMDMVEESLLICYKAVEKLDNKCEKLLEYLNFAKQYSVNFVIDEAEILALHCESQKKEIFHLLLPLVLKTETYDVAKNVLKDEMLQQEPKYVCYLIVLEILLGAPESKINRLIEKLSKQERTNMVQATLAMTRSILDLDVHIPPLEIVKEYKLEDNHYLMLLKKIQSLNYY